MAQASISVQSVPDLLLYPIKADVRIICKTDIFRYRKEDDMGILSRIFITESDKTKISAESRKINLIEYYKEKYEKMQKEGKRIDWYEYRTSIDAGWPYPVATECERDHIENYGKQVLRMHAIDISSLLWSYKTGIMEAANDTECTLWQDDDKVEYWKQVLIDGAANGDRTFQAALICSLGVFDGVYSKWLTEDEKQRFRRLYEQKLLEDAQAEDGIAMYAVAQFGLGDATYKSSLRKELAEKAMNKGIGDAAYLRAELYKSESSDGTWEYGEVLKFYAKGADADNGAMIGIMQKDIADAYRKGEYGFPEDKEKAVYYYNLAVKNGNSRAEKAMELFKL